VIYTIQHTYAYGHNHHHPAVYISYTTCT